MTSSTPTKSADIPSALDRARELVMLYGWNSAAYQILNPGMSLWFSKRCDAVVGYVDTEGFRVVAGAPVCSATELTSVLAEFEDLSLSEHRQTCYFCAGSRLASHFRSTSPSQSLNLGAEPVWTAESFLHAMQSKASLRAQCSRARNKGVVVRQWSNAEVQGDTRLSSCLNAWLRTRRLPPLHFLIEAQTLDRLYDRRVFVAERGDTIVGFSVISPIPTRNGWLVEQNIRHPAAPNGTVELILNEATTALAEQHVDYFTLGLAPLALEGRTGSQDLSMLDYLLRVVRTVGQPLYDFKGLNIFKAKFIPDFWEPIYAIRGSGAMNLPTLYAIATAFSGGSPLKLALRGIKQRIGHSESK